jgi:uncharacterized membrane protein YeaQ/YmgE (transglycosylase-associated protein family)
MLCVRCLAMGFHPSKARLDGQFLLVQPSGPRGPLQLLMNIVLGIVGAAIASAIFSFFGMVVGGWIGYQIAGFIGACLLIWIVRAVRGRTA